MWLLWRSKKLSNVPFAGDNYLGSKSGEMSHFDLGLVGPKDVKLASIREVDVYHT